MNTIKKRTEYSASLRRFMSHKTGQAYGKEHTFNDEELLAITPDDLVKFFNLLAYGVDSPDADAKPTACRSSTLYNYKKKISFFHPRKNQPWDPIWGKETQRAACK